jgi:hypothetical protein
MNHDNFAAARFYEIPCAVLDLPVQLTPLMQLEKGRKSDQHQGEATMLQYSSQRRIIDPTPNPDEVPGPDQFPQPEPLPMPAP